MAHRMTTQAALSSLIFPRPLPTLADLEAHFPVSRNLPDGATVTRFAPSPTGSMHIGGVYIAMLAKDLADKSNGTYFVRIEDTDQERKVESSLRQFEQTFDYFDIAPKESTTHDAWGPYVQSERAEIYLAHAKHLLNANRAYPCFCTKDDLEQKSQAQTDAKVDIGYYGAWAPCRSLTPAESIRRIEAGVPYVLRFKANAQAAQTSFVDLIRGEVTLKENFNDVVLLKSSASPLPLPTYHLAHAADDHLMRVSLVLRSDEWISSVPLHLQLFDALGYPRIPYAHISPLMKNDGASRRKLSKRKDPEASVSYYMEQGYPQQAVAIYLRGIANSRLQDADFAGSMSQPIHLNEINKSGALLDMKKLEDLSSNFISTLSAPEILSAVTAWATLYDPLLLTLLNHNPSYSEQVIDTDRFSSRGARKDLKRWSDFKDVYGFFFSDPTTSIQSVESVAHIKPDHQTALLRTFADTYNHPDSNEEWMIRIADIAGQSGFATHNKAFKAGPTQFHGSLTDAIQILRIAITGKTASPSLFEIIRTMGQQAVFERVERHVLSLHQSPHSRSSRAFPR
jgi:glutamyl-tRNA synthetase